MFPLLCTGTAKRKNLVNSEFADTGKSKVFLLPLVFKINPALLIIH